MSERFGGKTIQPVIVVKPGSAGNGSTVTPVFDVLASATRSITGKKCNGFRIRLAGAPTGGTFVLTMPGNGAAAEDVTIAYADNALKVYALLVAMAVFTPENIAAVGGGPLPNSVDVHLTDDLSSYPWQDIVVKTNSLTGGTTPQVYIEEIVQPAIVEDQFDGAYDGYVAYDFIADKTSGSGSGAFTPNQAGYSLGDGYSGKCLTGATGTPFTITSAALAGGAGTVIQCTKVGHGLNSSYNQRVHISGGTGMTGINGDFYAKRISADVFELYFDVAGTILQTGTGTYDANSATVAWVSDAYPGYLANKTMVGTSQTPALTTPVALDLNQRRLALFAYNPYKVQLSINMVYGPTAGIGAYSAAHWKNLAYTIPVGHLISLSSLPCAAAASGVESATAKTASALVGAFTYAAQYVYQSDEMPSFYADAWVWLRKSLPIVAIFADDNQDTWNTYGVEILRRYPKLRNKLNLAIRKDVIGTSNYLTLAQLQAMRSEGLIAGCCNHSANHVAFEDATYAAGADPQTCFILSATAFGTGNGSGPFLQITFSNGVTTSNIPCGGAKIQLKDVQPAIDAAMTGSLAGLTCTITTCDYFSGIVNTTQRLRLTFSQPIAKPTVAVVQGAGTTTVALNYAYPSSAILADYDLCRAYLDANGLSENDSGKVAVYPNGQYGKAVHEAMVLGQYKLGLMSNGGDGTEGYHATPLVSVAHINPWRIGRIDLPTVTTFKAVLGDALRFGGIVPVMMHGLHDTTNTSGASTARAHFEAAWSFLSDNHGSALDVMNGNELYDHARNLAQSDAAWTRGYGAA